jgi:4-hydroxy-tetrahydrodipicolinate reductase
MTPLRRSWPPGAGQRELATVTGVDETIRVGVNGAGGRMGTAVCAAVSVDPALTLVAAVDPHAVGDDRAGVAVAHDLRAFADAACDVVVDFTVADAARTSVPWLAMHGIHAVVGTTGLDDADIDAFRQAFGDGPAHCLLAPNFAISAVLMIRFAELAAPYFDTAEIIEYHHDRKIDAPSGTAVNTAERMAAARGDVPWRRDPTEREVYRGARGGTGPTGIHVHSVRMQGMIAHQDVILGALGQTLRIRQDSYDRDSFMPGVLLACKHVADHPGVTVGLDRVLGL